MPRMNLPELEQRRVYWTPQGVRVPGVTDVLHNLEDDSWIQSYIKKHGRAVWEQKKHDATSLGNEIHTVAYNIAKTDGAYTPPAAHLKPFASAIKDFHEHYIDEVIAVEFGLASDRERVGGTCDLFAVLKNGKTAVLDYKSKGNKGAVTGRDWLQTAAYTLLLEDAGYDVDERGVILLRTDPERRGEWYVRFASQKAEAREGDFDAFRAAVELYHWKPRAKWRYPRTKRAA